MRSGEDVQNDDRPDGLGFFKAILIALPLSLILWLLIAIGFVYGQSPIVGHDFLALQSPKFLYKKLLPAIHKPSALGLLDYTFGTSLTPVSYMLDSGKFSYLRVHLINGSCIRLRNCGPYYPFKVYSPASFESAVRRDSPKIRSFIESRTLAYCNLLAGYPSTTLLISPVLEHNLSKTAWRKLAAIVANTCPSSLLVNSSMEGEPYKGVLNERHTPPDQNKADILSMDGWDYTSYMTNQLYNPAYKIVFVWDTHYNCREPGSFIDPRKRTSCPDSKEVKYLERLFTGR